MITVGTGIASPLRSNTSVSSFPVALPSYAAGDVWLLAVACAGNFAITTPAGWTLVDYQPQTGSGGQDLAVFVRVPDGSEGSTVSVAFSAATRFAAALTYRVTGADTTALLSGAAHGQNDTAAATSLPNTGVTTTDDDAALFVFAAQHTTDAAYTLPASFGGKTETFGEDPFDSGRGVNLAGGHKTQASAGASGSLAVTSTLSAPWSSVALALTPAAAPPSLGACLLGVADSTALTAGDVAIRDRLTAGGFTVTPFDDEDTPSLTGVDLVVLADSGVDATYGTGWATAAVPVLALGGMVVNLRLGTTAPTLRTGATGAVDLVNNTHPANVGLADPLVIFAPAQARWAAGNTSLASGVTRLALTDNDTTATVAAAAEAGATLTTGTAPARRAFATPLTDAATPFLSAAGLAWFDRLATWLIQPPEPAPGGDLEDLTLTPGRLTYHGAPGPTLRYTTDIDLGQTMPALWAGLPATFDFGQATEIVPVPCEVYIGGPSGEPIPIAGVTIGGPGGNPIPVQVLIGRHGEAQIGTYEDDYEDVY